MNVLQTVKLKIINQCIRRLYCMIYSIPSFFFWENCTTITTIITVETEIQLLFFDLDAIRLERL